VDFCVIEPRSEVFGNLRFGERATSIFRVDVRDYGGVSTAYPETSPLV
jgi:hypothetical protein